MSSDAKEEITTIDEGFQDKMLSCMLKVPEFISVSSEFTLPDYFDGNLRKNLCRMMCDFYTKYNCCLTPIGFTTILASLIKTGKVKKIEVESYYSYWKTLNKEKVTDWKFLLDQIVQFVKHQRIKNLINESVSKFLPKNNFEHIEQEMAKIAGINSGRRVKPYDYFNEKSILDRQSLREEELKSGKISISTGIKPLDDKLHAHGFYQKELYIFMAPPKRGKTMSLLWFSNQATLQGYNTAHFTCEVSREICSKRLDAMNTKTMIKDVDQYNKEVARRLMSKTPRGKLFLYEYPTKSLTPQKIELELDRLLNEHGVKIDFLVVDYLDIMRMPQPDRSTSWADQGGLAEELRRVAGEYLIPVVTATQVNRGGSGKAVTTGKDVSGNYEKIMIADEIFSFSATDDELKEGKLRINNSESRNSESGTILISTAFSYGQFFSDVIMDEEM